MGINQKEFMMLVARRVTAAVVGTLIALVAAACTSHPPVARGTTKPDPVPSPSASPSTPNSGLSGTLYYVEANWPNPLLRSSGNGLTQVLPAAGDEVNVSPDGQHIAYVDRDGALVVTDRDGNHARTVTHGLAKIGYAPTWSPDGTRLLVARPGPNGSDVPGVLDVATGGYTPLAHDPHGIHYLWSADGRHLGYATPDCRLGVADPDGGNAHLIPVLGSDGRKLNPDDAFSCYPSSISPDGSKMAVGLNIGDRHGNMFERGFGADAVIDTRTGAWVRLPVTGKVTVVLYQRDGTVLVGTDTGLVLLSADGTVIARGTEPADAKGRGLLAYVPA